MQYIPSLHTTHDACQMGRLTHKNYCSWNQMVYDCERMSYPRSYFVEHGEASSFPFVSLPYYQPHLQTRHPSRKHSQGSPTCFVECSLTTWKGAQLYRFEFEAGVGRAEPHKQEQPCDCHHSRRRTIQS